MHIETQIQLCNRTFKKMETPDVYTHATNLLGIG